MESKNLKPNANFHEKRELASHKPGIKSPLTICTVCKKDFDRVNLLRVIDEKCKEIQSLETRTNKVLDEKNVVESESRRKDKEIAEMSSKNNLQDAELMGLKKIHESSLKQIQVLKGKLKIGPKDRETSNEQVCVSILQKRVDVLERQLTKEQLIGKKLLEIKFRPHKWRTLEFENFEHFRLLQKHLMLQDQYKKTVKELTRTELLMKEKDGVSNNVEKHDESNSCSDLRQKLIANTKTIRTQERDIKKLKEQVKMYENLISAYRDEASRLKSLVPQKKSV